MFKGLNDMAKTVHENAKNKGWWEDGERNFGEMCALITSEVSEAFEEYRKGVSPRVVYLSKDGKPEGIGIELADVVIRILDYCAYTNIDIEAMITRKHLYNTTRPYRHGGKKA